MAKKRKVESESESEPEEQAQVKLETEPIEEDLSEEEEETAGEEEAAKPEGSQEPPNDDDEDDLTKVLEPFTKEQLIELLKTFASADPKLTDEIHRVADSDPAQRKLFVHGLGWETTSETLREFYSQYGEIEECNVVADKITGKSKGYGFLSFKHRKSAQKALREPQKQIESRMTACQLASAGPVSGGAPPPQHFGTLGHSVGGQDNLQRKIYVGNVHSEISSDRLHAFFSKYGEIEEGPLGFDKQTGRAKGYALFIYKTVEGAKKALEEPSKTFEGHLLYCQRATDNKKEKASSANASSKASGASQAAGGGYTLPGAAYGVPNGAMALQGSVANPAMYGQGMMAGAQQFGAGVAPIQAALAVLAAAGHNPGAFGVSPASYASLNPALLAAVPPGMQGYGMANPGFLNPQGHQAIPYPSGSGGQASTGRPHSGMRPMGGGYMGR